jgi:hypothetical protein
MIAFIERIRTYLSANSESLFAGLNPSLRMVKSRKGIIKELVNSKNTGTVLGIYCPALGEGMFLTGVEDFFTAGTEQIVELKRYDLNGVLLQRDHISLAEIKTVCPFRSMYTNPVFNKKTHFAY